MILAYAVPVTALIHSSNSANCSSDSIKHNFIPMKAVTLNEEEYWKHKSTLLATKGYLLRPSLQANSKSQLASAKLRTDSDHTAHVDVCALY